MSGFKINGIASIGFNTMVLLLSSCDDTSGTYIISEVAFKVNNLSEQEKQKTINEFINQEVLLTVLKGKIELTLSNKPTTSKITLQRGGPGLWRGHMPL